MKIMKSYIILPALAGLAFTATAGLAQDVPADDPGQAPDAQAQPPADGSASVNVGDTVYGSDGSPAGTIQAIEGGNAVLSTGTVTVQIPVSAISQGANGATIGLTKAEVEAQAGGAPAPR